ncbi:MAG: glucose-6-phosphate dehydrogenase assembly protein OpcA [Opitutales bacterium]
MASLIDTLPGLRMPVADVTAFLSRMWHQDPEQRNAEHSAFRASQMNLVLHFGLATSEEEARERFDTAIEFAQRYPCRIIVLCPEREARGEDLLEGKLFTQCYIGQSLRSMCCCEALMLSYPPNEDGFLENQVSIWLESDLPTYHWFNRVPLDRISEQYLDFVRLARRVLYDSSVEPEGFADLDWPHPRRVYDLARARLLPVLQSVGQFLSSYRPAVLVEDLEAVTVRHPGEKRGEGRNLLEWVKGGITGCCEQSGAQSADDIAFRCENWDQEDEGLHIRMEWSYAGDRKQFSWDLEDKTRMACIRADFGQGVIEHPQKVKKMPRAQALSEALFF